MVNVGVKLRDKERNRGSFMALKKKPVTGMKDILPAEMQIRDYVLNQIKETYRGFGFSAIETPCVEHIENLLSKQGGDDCSSPGFMRPSGRSGTMDGPGKIFSSCRGRKEMGKPDKVYGERRSIADCVG